MNCELTEHGQSLLLTLNRPEKGNAFHLEMILEVTDLFKKISAENKHKLIFLEGKGKHFCTGADLKWMQSASSITEEENIQQMNDLITMYKVISSCPLPIITFVHGCVYGGGIGLCSLSDYVIADENTQFCLSEMNYGLLPGALTPFLLQKVGKTNFMKWALKAEVFGSEEATNCGLVTATGNRNDALKIFETFSHFPDVALKNLKKSVQLCYPDLNSYFEQLKFLSAECRINEEGQSRMKSFTKK